MSEDEGVRSGSEAVLAHSVARGVCDISAQAASLKKRGAAATVYCDNYFSKLVQVSRLET